MYCDAFCCAGFSFSSRAKTPGCGALMKEYGALFADDARFVNVLGQAEDGRREIADAHRMVHKTIFKDSAVYIERYLKTARHTEVQIVCDQYGAGVHLVSRNHLANEAKAAPPQEVSRTRRDDHLGSPVEPVE